MSRGVSSQWGHKYSRCTRGQVFFARRFITVAPLFVKITDAGNGERNQQKKKRGEEEEEGGEKKEKKKSKHT